MREAHAQAAALGSQIESIETAGRLSAEELKLNEKLASEGFVPRARLLPLQRADADYRSRLGESRGELALSRQRTAELAARMADARNRYQQAATDELEQSSSRLREIEERLRPSKDQVDRQAIRSPVDGVVMGMRVSAPGDVLAAGAPIADVVPSNELLVVEARIRPQDINHVFADAKAKVRLAAYDARTTPLLPGRVTFVSPDRMSDPANRRVVVRGHGRGGHRRAQTSSRNPAQGRHACGAVRDDFQSHAIRIPREADHRLHEPRAARNLNYQPEENITWPSQAHSVPVC